MRGLVGGFVGVLLAVGGAAADGTKGEDKGHGEKTTQGERMRRCSQEAAAEGLKGDERKEFMSRCLRGERAGGARSGS